MVKRFKPKFTLLEREILEFLFLNAGSFFNQRNLAKSLGVSSTAVSKSLKKLENDKLLIKSKDSSTKIISIGLNRDNPLTIQLKRADNLRRIYESGLYNYFEEAFFGATLILFGSYSFGEDISNSDIDIAVIGRKEKGTDLKVFEKILNRKIVIQFYPDFKHIHKNLRENIFNGIVLKGGVEV
jgi:predicted nucleotidyltransferase